VVDLRERAHLAVEPPRGVLVVPAAGVHHLERDDPVESEIDRAVNNPHPATADHLFDAVARYVRQVCRAAEVTRRERFGLRADGLVFGVPHAGGGGDGAGDRDHRLGRRLGRRG
jgi:hypothetical protein